MILLWVSALSVGKPVITRVYLANPCLDVFRRIVSAIYSLLSFFSSNLITARLVLFYHKVLLDYIKVVLST